MLPIKHVMKAIPYWPPFLGAGISVAAYDLDAGYIVSKLRRTPFNGNAFGTHFGGSLFSMCDPWYVFLAIHHLGPEYIVWDFKSEIQFVKALKEPVFARFEICPEMVSTIRQKTAEGNKFLQPFSTQVLTANNELVANVAKTIYVRRKKLR